MTLRQARPTRGWPGDGRARDDRPRGDPRAYDYAHPTRACDVVMKGGITSGVVYPHALCELAVTYRFSNVGGTSAGAIAAAAAAAAEHGRERRWLREAGSAPGVDRRRATTSSGCSSRRWEHAGTSGC